MEQDTRIGLALGILLMGVVAALFFRNEPSSDSRAPEMSDPDSLNQRIAERSVGPYLSPKRPSAKRRIPKVRPEVLAHNAQRTSRRGSDSRGQGFGKPGPIPGTGRRSASTPNVRRDLHVPPTRFQPEDRVPEPPAIAETEQSAGSDPEVKPQLQEYEVLHGDTLSDIAQRFLGSSTRYMEIFELNRDRLQTPHDLRTGHRIRVPLIRR